MATRRNESKDRLFKVILQLQSIDDCYDFFEDLCTIKEIDDMAQRLDAAVLLDRGENYRTIASQVGISTATISRVSRCLGYGSGGYRKAIDLLQEEKEK